MSGMGDVKVFDKETEDEKGKKTPYELGELIWKSYIKPASDPDKAYQGLTDKEKEYYHKYVDHLTAEGVVRKGLKGTP